MKINVLELKYSFRPNIKNFIFYLIYNFCNAIELKLFSQKKKMYSDNIRNTIKNDEKNMLFLETSVCIIIL